MKPDNLLTQTKRWLRKYGIPVTKRLGQHFLVDELVLQKIIDFADLSMNEKILEIGTGLGTLTEKVVEQVQHVFTIEKDAQLIQILRKRWRANDQITLIHGDAVKVDWPTCDKLVANLPFGISSPVVFKFLDTKIPFAVLMLQQELAQRLAAVPGTKDYGRITVMIAYSTSVELLVSVKSESFYPPPNVTSSLVRITRQVKPAFPVSNYPLFAQLVTTLFGQRRKKLRTPLKAFLQTLNIKPKNIENIQSCVPWLDRRAEELAPEELAKIANIIHEEYPL